jgi:hypothetical protein
MWMMSGHYTDRNETPNKLSLGYDLRISPMRSLEMPACGITTPDTNRVSVILIQIMR